MTVTTERPTDSEGGTVALEEPSSRTALRIERSEHGARFRPISVQLLRRDEFCLLAVQSG